MPASVSVDAVTQEWGCSSPLPALGLGKTCHLPVRKNAEDDDELDHADEAEGELSQHRGRTSGGLVERQGAARSEERARQRGVSRGMRQGGKRDEAMRQ